MGAASADICSQPLLEAAGPFFSLGEEASSPWEQHLCWGGTHADSHVTESVHRSPMWAHVLEIGCWERRLICSLQLHSTAGEDHFSILPSELVESH